MSLRKVRDAVIERDEGRCMEMVCIVDNCGKFARSRNSKYCEKHYMRMYRHGNLDGIREQRDKRGICVIDGCARIDDGLDGLCKMHKTRVRRHGDHETVKRPTVRKGSANHAWTGDNATYQAVHLRLKQAKGHARKHSCVDCGRSAAHWSYNHTALDERDSASGPYSLDLDDYDPRCTSCHWHFDRRVHGAQKH